MKIHNIRFGFATNSSSSHSIIFDPNINYDEDDDQFGWNYFTLASKDSKDQYMAHMLSQNLEVSNFPKNLIAAILKGLNLPSLDPDNYGIDHQSLFFIPKEYGTEHISIEFFNEFRDYLSKDGIVILGGNDNDDAHPLYDETKEISLNGYIPEQVGYVCRKDGSWWTLYNQVNGTRVVLSFKDNPEPFQPKTPMLIDFTITHFCDIGCPYCFQGSTKSGEHMDKTNDEYLFLWNMVKAKVFEVAIGGGEPTYYPDFDKMLIAFKRNGIVANFTTKSLKWLENEQFATTIMDNIGAFAFSATNTNDLDRIKDIMKYRKYSWNKFTVQIVPATLHPNTLENILKWCSENFVRVTLLGFKETGRGAKFKEIAINRNYDKFDESQFINVIKKLSEIHSCPIIAIDTTLANRFEEQLKNADIPDYLYHIQEGKYSAYIDGVARKFGPSSYHLDKLIPYDSTSTIEELFAKIESV